MEIVRLQYIIFSIPYTAGLYNRTLFQRQIKHGVIKCHWITYGPTDSNIRIFNLAIRWGGRSQWQRDLRHEPSSPFRTLGYWVRIPLEAWMSVCVYFVCVVLCVVSGLAKGLIPRPRSPTDYV
jgi:hypothetical protein